MRNIQLSWFLFLLAAGSFSILQSCGPNGPSVQLTSGSLKHPNIMNVVYHVPLQLDSNGAFVFSENDSAQLKTLKSAGVNTLLVTVADASTLQTLLSAIRKDSLFNQFKYLVDIGDTLSALYASCVSCDPPAAMIQSIVETALQNEDLVAGYYAFDEPAGRHISASFQRAVHDLIRSLDPDSQARPVAIAQTMYFNASEYYDEGAQDVLFVDQYNADQQTEIEWFEKLNSLQMLNKPIVLILPAYSFGLCTSSIQQVYSADIAGLTLANKTANLIGLGFYAFQPEGAETFDLDNCPVMLKDALTVLSF